MPTYAYACKQCGHRFDAVQSFADAALTECPVCGGDLKKQYGTIGVTFNGSGFYRTDSRPKQGGEGGSSGSGSGSGDSGSSGSGSGSTGGDAKPSTSSESTPASSSSASSPTPS